MLAYLSLVLHLTAVSGPCDTLPRELQRAIAKALPGAEVPAATTADTAWKEYQSADDQSDGHPYCVTGDFNGDGSSDYALVLRDGNRIRLWAFHRTRAGYSAEPMWVERGTERMLTIDLLATIALYRRSPGTFEDMYDARAALAVKHPAVEVIHFDASSWIMAWDGTRYETFWTSD